jgi:hypothetical protein
MNDNDFDHRLSQIALPWDDSRTDGGAAVPGIVSLTLLAVGLGLAAVFFLTGMVLMFFCIGILVWYFGAALVLIVSSSGAILGLVAMAANPYRPVEQMIGCLGLVLNAALAGGCAWVLATLFG